ncbi:MAG: type I restriction endonuclease, partial [Melioribacteraceae bacterium]
MSLFQKSVIKKYLSNLDSKEVNSAYHKFKEFYGDSERIENIKLLKEENYQEGFLREIFVQVLGYTINPDKNYNLTTEFKNETDTKKADGAILQDGNAIGVIELKSTKTVNLESITTQAFNYKNHQNKCRFVITSNFEKLNFYIDNATEWEEFNLFSLTENDFKLFYFLLNCKNILAGIPLKVKEESRLHEENISDKLYKDYSQFKHRIYNNLV